MEVTTSAGDCAKEVRCLYHSRIHFLYTYQRKHCFKYLSKLNGSNPCMLEEFATSFWEKKRNKLYSYNQPGSLASPRASCMEA